MKKVYLTLLLALTCLVSGMANKNLPIRTDGPKITITIEIGRKPSCFMAWAICDFTIGGLGLTANVESFPVGDGSGGGGGGSWKLSMSRENFAKYYSSFLVKLDGKSSVTFDEAFTVPADVKKALGSTKDLIIRGNVAYPLKYENGEFVITFPL